MATQEIQRICRTDGTPDNRFSVAWEYTGHTQKWAVARFKGHWIGESTTENAAWTQARTYAKGEG